MQFGTDDGIIVSEDLIFKLISCVPLMPDRRVDESPYHDNGYDIRTSHNLTLKLFLEADFSPVECKLFAINAFTSYKKSFF